MTITPDRWHDLPFYKKLKYVAELVAIFGGLCLLGVNAYQIVLLRQSNATNYEMFKSTFPLEVEAVLTESSDKNPIDIKIRLTNVVGQMFDVQASLPEYISSSSHEFSLSPEIRARIYKGKTASENSSWYDKVILRPSESCTLELTANMKIRSSYRSVIKHMPAEASFIIVPIVLRGAERNTQRTLLVSLGRDTETGSLVVTSDLLKDTDRVALSMMIALQRRIRELPDLPKMSRK